MRLLSALRRGLGQIKIRILLGYFAILLIPFLLILHSLISSIYERGCDQRQNILNNSLSNYASIIEQYATQAVYAADAVQSNQFLTDILSCNIFSVSDEVYTYNRYVNPLLQYLLLSNDLESIVIYRKYPSFLTYNRYFQPLEEIPLSESLQNDILQGKSAWQIVSSDEKGIRYHLYKKLSMNNQRTTLGIVEITLDLTEKIDSLIRDNEVYLTWFDRTTQRRLTSGDSFSPSGDNLGNIHATAVIPQLNVEITLWDLSNSSPMNAYQSVTLNVLLLLAASLLYYVILWRYFRHFSRLAKHINQNRTNNTLSVYPMLRETYDEIGMLTSAYNGLVLQINELIRTQYIAEINRQKAENYAMRMQINPHFLYNALECIRMIAYEHNDFMLSESICTLSDFMHYNFSHKGENAAFSDELTHIRLYFALMRLSMEDRFSGIIEVNADIQDFHCPFFILQPIVENAFTHGFRNSIQQCTILVRAESQNGFVIVRIEDNGCGFSPEHLHEIQQRIHLQNSLQAATIGLNNVYARMKQFFGDAFELHLENAPHGGAAVILQIPIRKEDLLEHTLG